MDSLDFRLWHLRNGASKICFEFRPVIVYEEHKDFAICASRAERGGYQVYEMTERFETIKELYQPHYNNLMEKLSVNKTSKTLSLEISAQSDNHTTTRVTENAISLLDFSSILKDNANLKINQLEKDIREVKSDLSTHQCFVMMGAQGDRYKGYVELANIQIDQNIDLFDYSKVHLTKSMMNESEALEFYTQANAELEDLGLELSTSLENLYNPGEITVTRSKANGILHVIFVFDVKSKDSNLPQEKQPTIEPSLLSDESQEDVDHSFSDGESLAECPSSCECCQENKFFGPEDKDLILSVISIITINIIAFVCQWCKNQRLEKDIEDQIQLTNSLS